MRAIFCVLLLLAGRPSPGATTKAAIPNGRTPAAKLATPTMQHHEVMRIDRDFGKARWEIALDGWMPRTRADHIEDIRLWWVDTEDGDARKPFNAHLRRFVALTYDRQPDGHLAVRLEGDRKAYQFSVEQHAGGALAVFADVTLADGTTVPHCRAQRGRLVARRVWGIPIGIGGLNVTCVDAESRVLEGAVPYEELASGAVWENP